MQKGIERRTEKKKRLESQSPVPKAAVVEKVREEPAAELGIPVEEGGIDGIELEFDRDRIIQGIIFAEILGKPRARSGIYGKNQRLSR